MPPAPIRMREMHVAMIILTAAALAAALVRTRRRARI
jgi:hypothetical protein